MEWQEAGMFERSWYVGKGKGDLEEKKRERIQQKCRKEEKQQALLGKLSQGRSTTPAKPTRHHVHLTEKKVVGAPKFPITGKHFPTIVTQLVRSSFSLVAPTTTSI